jgi:hypothetical protein
MYNSPLPFARFLGLILDSHLTLEPHIQQLWMKCQWSLLGSRQNGTA